MDVKNIKQAQNNIKKLISNTKKLENAYCTVQVDLGNLAKEHLNIINDIK
jgi:L-ribulose-5-phosphate 3-epimerase UlaE